MVKRRSFFVAFLTSVLVVGPAFSDENATQNWVKTWVPSWAENRGTNYFYTNAQGDKLSGFTAHQMRDLLYRHKADTAYAPDHSMVKTGYELRTQGQTAFEGINEVLEKVDGNNGTSGSAVQLETTAQNAYGAINELKDEISGKAAQADLQTLDNKVNNASTGLDSKAAQADLQTLTNKVNNASTGLDTKASKAELEALSQTIDGLQGNTYGGSNGVRVTGNTVGLSVTPEAGEMYIYTSNGWQKLPVDDTWN